MQVLQPDSSLRPEDARLATLGFHVAFDEVEPLRAAPPKPADTYVAPKKPEKKVEPVAPPPPPPPEVAPVAVDEAVVVGDTIVLGSKIFFEYASANIGSDSATLIENIARCILGHPEIELLEIDGHTDDIGGEKWNLELSEARANAVRDALIAKGVSAARLTTRGFGLSRPLVVGFDEASRAKNRRVELIIVRKAEQ
jgi:outer membrane protein OmpA-like peptidoglycan-associated protein